MHRNIVYKSKCYENVKKPIKKQFTDIVIIMKYHACIH